jgi:glycosyltransferase involved in cell wall biosynthesis
VAEGPLRAPVGQRRRRILHLITNLSKGGAETQLAWVCAGLLRLGWEIHVGYLETDEGHPTAGWHKEGLREQGVLLHRLTRSHRDARLLSRLIGLVRRVDPGVVQTWLPAMDFAGGLAARLCRVPWVVSERTSPAVLEPGVKGWLRTGLVKRADAIVSNSCAADDYWASRVPARTVRAVVRNALDLEALARVEPADRRSRGIPPGARLIVHVGRFHEGKNIVNLLEALARVVKARPAFALLCGVGEMEAFVQRFRTETGLEERILAPGFLPDVWSWVRAADVLVSASRFEGMPNAVMEAMALGCPAVVSDIPAHREILDEESALFVDAEDPRSLAAALEAVLDDPGAAARRAERARARASRWSIGALAVEHVRVYEALLENGP